MTVSTKIAVELVHFQPENPRASRMFRALIAAAPAAGIDLIETTAYRGASSWLLLWGPGHPLRRDAIAAHICRHEAYRAICFDLAYWQREDKVRVSFDAPHPQHVVMAKPLPRQRLVDDGIVPTDEWNPAGPIVIAGIGSKARIQYGAHIVDEWEADMMRDCAARWSKPIVYRPKKPDSPVPAWATRIDRSDPIGPVLRGAALVITWHSNVAVDAIRMGIPVVCRNGAAAAVCPSAIDDHPKPLAADVRDRFLANLAWFQWSASEADACWRFVMEMLS